MDSTAAPNDIRRDLVALLPRLRRFAQTLVPDPAVADRLVREVSLRAVNKSHHWKGQGRLESWVFSLIRSAWADAARSRAPGREAEAGQPSGNTAVSSSPVLALLPQGTASALLLVDAEGFSYEEAASILDIQPMALASLLCAARNHLAIVPPFSLERRA